MDQDRARREGFWDGAALIGSLFESIFEVIGAILGAIAAAAVSS